MASHVKAVQCYSSLLRLWTFFLQFSIGSSSGNLAQAAPHLPCWPHTSSQAVALFLLRQNQSSGACRSEAGSDLRTPTPLAPIESNPTMPAALACV